MINGKQLYIFYTPFLKILSNDMKNNSYFYSFKKWVNVKEYYSNFRVLN